MRSGLSVLDATGRGVTGRRVPPARRLSPEDLVATLQGARRE